MFSSRTVELETKQRLLMDIIYVSKSPILQISHRNLLILSKCRLISLVKRQRRGSRDLQQ